METQRRGRRLRRSARVIRRTAWTLGEAGRRLAERLAYRPRELVVVALLAAGLFGGLAIEPWRAEHPAIADRLEQESVRPTPAPQARAAPRTRARSVPARCEEPSAAAGTGRSGPPRLDLNRATPGELARAAGISWRLAVRIVAARDSVEGQAAPRDAPEGTGAVSGTEPLESDPSGTGTTEPAPDAETP
jgi:hypothetical protein